MFLFERIEHLDDPLAWEAITRPAEEESVLWDDDAVRFVITETSGYPYFIQQFGQEAWNEAPGPTITLSDAKIGAARGRHALDLGFFRARWERATKSEQAYLRAMAVDGDTKSSSGEVAVRLERTASSLGPARAALISKGLVYAPEHGVVALPVPGMAEFVLRQPL